jgi:hypothetical protein
MRSPSNCAQFQWAQSKHRRHTIHPVLNEWLSANDPQRFLFCLSHVFPFPVCSFLLRLFRWLVVYSFHCFTVFWISALLLLQSIRERIQFQHVLFLEFSLCKLPLRMGDICFTNSAVWWSVLVDGDWLSVTLSSAVLTVASWGMSVTLGKAMLSFVQRILDFKSIIEDVCTWTDKKKCFPSDLFSWLSLRGTCIPAVVRY